MRLSSELRPVATATDPTGPVSVALAGGQAVVANSAGLTFYSAKTLAPVGAVGLAGASQVASDGVLTAAITNAQGGTQVCLVTLGTAAPCSPLAAAPTGLGVAGSDIVVADGAGGSILPFSFASGLLQAGTPISVGAKPHGRIVTRNGLTYIPIDHGIAIADLSKGTLVGTIKTATTPADIAIAPGTGRLFAALPGSGGVAIADTAAPAEPVKAVATGSKPASVITEQSGGALVLNDDGSAVRLDPAGALTGPAGSIPAGAPVTAITAGAPVFKTEDLVVRATIPLTGGKLDKGGFKVTDKAIADGRASFELWQGGITSAVKTKAGGGLTITVVTSPGRLQYRVTAAAKQFEKIAITQPNRQTVSIVATKPAPKPSPGAGRRR